MLQPCPTSNELPIFFFSPLLTSCLSSAISGSFLELQILRCWKASRMFIREYLWPGTYESEGRETGLGRDGEGGTVIRSQWRGLSWPSGSHGAQIFQVRMKGWAFVSGCGLPLERDPTGPSLIWASWGLTGIPSKPTQTSDLQTLTEVLFQPLSA